MNAFKSLRTAAFAGVALAFGASAQANQKVCVYDLLGASGDVFNQAKDYALEMQKNGAQIELKAYTDERVATEDFRTGQCDGVMAMGFRTRQFNAVSASIDTLGSTTILRNGKIDMEGSYEVVRRVIQTFARPEAAKLMVEGKYEVAGILPMGAAYPVVNDRKINSVEALAGKKIAAFDYDKAQAVMIQKIGAQPVSADVSNFSTKFNNGSVDFVAAPALAYKPLELYKGVGKKGAVVRFPILILSYQMVINQAKFPAGFGQKSREYWSSNFDRAKKVIDAAELSIPAETWMDLTAQDGNKYTLMLRESRVDIAKQGLYNKTGLKVLKRVRCSVNAADAECATKSEEEWQ